ncbi:beta strand repeat-containing protein [Hansschlegelia sp. KR7-227]|uniref:beta strand repeat-containing protein n=1 Tax=Hansschlegelia sp. KR7-227 TaxID=3400914 RepID=UPI003C0D4D3A
MAVINGTILNDFIHRAGDGRTPPQGAVENDGVTAGPDTITGGLGDDTIFGDGGDDVANVDLTLDGADEVDLGDGMDRVNVDAMASTNVRLTFTSSEVGNGLATDGGAMTNQDGGLAVRMQGEITGVPSGPVGRYDDEGVTFVGGAGVTFDVRDLVSGVARGEQFEVVTLGTSAADTLDAVQSARPYYINGGQGADTITDGSANDFLVGGAGDDTLTATMGDDSFIGGGGNDVIAGGAGSDVATVNVATDGADRIDLGADGDVVNVATATGATTNVRLFFTSSEVGNGSATDSDTMAKQDGGLAVRMQAENADGFRTGPVTRVDDEGVTFVAGAGVTFDVRDLVSGAQRGEAFEVVTLGTSGADALTAVQSARPYYINAGQGADTLTGGSGDDFLVGGAGADMMSGLNGDDSYIVDNAGDAILEGLGGGDDRVLSSVSFSLGGQNLEDLTLMGTSAINGVGNSLDNVLVGNAASNVLSGRVGADTMDGGAGNDVFVVDDAGDVVMEAAGGGIDLVRSLVDFSGTGANIEKIALIGTDDVDAAGNSLANRIIGNSGDNAINGRLGADVLTGGAGADTFVFSSPLGRPNIDRVTDFGNGDDGFLLDRAAFAGLDLGSLDEDAFTVGRAASDAEDRIVYNSQSGALIFDRDGSGSRFDGVKFAQLDAGLTLRADDFFVV